MDLGDGRGHLTYSTLVHPGDTWSDMRESLVRFVPEVKKRFSPDRAMGVSLRISNASSVTLENEASERAWLSDFLAAEDLYVYTVNAFPYGPFKDQVVKEMVYEPDWSTDERTQYTMRVARILAEISQPSVEPTIQSAPLAFRPKVSGDAYINRFTENVFQVIAHLMQIERQTGRRVKLALEPEPFCFLETIPETIQYFEERIFTADAAQRVSTLSGTALAEAFQGIRRHLGLVFAICHQSVAFDDIQQD